MATIVSRRFKKQPSLYTQPSSILLYGVSIASPNALGLIDFAIVLLAGVFNVIPRRITT